MKNLAMILLIGLISTTAFGQKVKPTWNEKNNEILVKGNYYASLEKKSSEVLTAKDWWISNIKGDVIIQFKTESYATWKALGDKDYLGRPIQEQTTSYRVRVIFPETGSYAFLSSAISSTPLGIGVKQVMKKITGNELIKDGDLDWEKAVMFIEGNGGEVFANRAPEPSNDPVVIVGNDVYQNGEIIGKVNKRDTGSEYEYSVYNADGTKVMTASIPKENPFEWVLTEPNGNEQTVLYENDPDGIRILTYLSKIGIFNIY